MPSTATISTSDPVSGAREALRLARMLCREAAALRPDRDMQRALPGITCGVAA